MIRRLRSILMWIALVMAIPSAALGHGLELARDDSPIPVTLFLGGAAVVLAVSFIGVSKTWTTSRLQGGPRSGRVTGAFGTKMVPVARWTGVVCLALVVITGLGAGDLGYGGLSPILVWIGFWLAVPFVSAVVGDVWTPMNPWRRMGEWLGLGERERPELLERWGVYPAAVLLGAFAWFEIVYPESASGRSLGLAALVYTVAMAGVMVLAGRETGLQMAEAFTTYNRAISAVAPRGRTAGGRIIRRGWLRALPVLPRWRGLSLFVVVMIATVSFDSLESTLWFRDRLAEMGINSSEMWVGTVGLIAMIALIGSGYWLACTLAALGNRVRSIHDRVGCIVVCPYLDSDRGCLRSSPLLHAGSLRGTTSAHCSERPIRTRVGSVRNVHVAGDAVAQRGRRLVGSGSGDPRGTHHRRCVGPR